MTGILVRVIGALLFCSALALPLVYAPDRSVTSLVALWAPPPSVLIDLNGQLLHYRDEGPRDDPAPLLLLHGTSSSLHTWDGWARALRGQRRVIRLDLPGFGLTGPFTGSYAGRPYTAESYARFVLDVLDHLAVPRAVLAGNSLGGEVAWRIAALAPQRVAALVLVDAGGYRITGGEFPLAWKIARTPVLGHLAEHLLPRALVIQGLHTVYGDPSRITDLLADRYYELTLREGNRAALVQRLQQGSPADGVAKVTGVTAPTLVLWGARDRVIASGYAQRFAADIPGARVQVFDDLGHVPQEEDPARTAQAVQAFLADP
jgi:pimeloyl-ACP methyl ester carboxylesterase